MDETGPMEAYGIDDGRALPLYALLNIRNNQQRLAPCLKPSEVKNLLDDGFVMIQETASIDHVSKCYSKY